jgi:hypothetical protein
LDRSLPSHTNKKPFECSKCSKGFTRRWSLRQHVIGHTGITPYRCSWEGCDKWFKKQYLLDAHITIHTGETPYRCLWEGCEKAYSRPEYLRNHKRSSGHLYGGSNSKARQESTGAKLLETEESFSPSEQLPNLAAAEDANSEDPPRSNHFLRSRSKTTLHPRVEDANVPNYEEPNGRRLGLGMSRQSAQPADDVSMAGDDEKEALFTISSAQQEVGGQNRTMLRARQMSPQVTIEDEDGSQARQTEDRDQARTMDPIGDPKSHKAEPGTSRHAAELHGVHEESTECSKEELIRDLILRRCPNIQLFMRERIESQLVRCLERFEGLQAKNSSPNAVSASKGSSQACVNPLILSRLPLGMLVPRTQELPALFDCHLCFKAEMMFLTTGDWAEHVYADLEPYACTYEDCKRQESFSDKYRWNTHEKKMHQEVKRWICNLKNCKMKGKEWCKKQMFERHLQACHVDFLRGKEILDFVDKCSRTTYTHPDNEPCVFCGQKFTELTALNNHKSEHMKEIYLDAIPLIAQSKDNDEEKASSWDIIQPNDPRISQPRLVSLFNVAG